MVLAKQTLANKNNARRSTGPKTKLGKEKVLMNAMKLGSSRSFLNKRDREYY